jgi:hypothetical protein
MGFNWTPEQIAWLTNEAPKWMKAQREHVEQVARTEAERRAALGDDTLPEGVFDTKEEALAYLDAQRAAGRFTHAIDDGTGNGDFTVKVSGGFVGHPEIWLTHVTDTADPAFPDEK